MGLEKSKAPEKAPESETPADAVEPGKFVPSKAHQSYDTPSGRALAKAGAPNPDEAGSEKEAKRGEEYASEKHKVRWGY